MSEMVTLPPEQATEEEAHVPTRRLLFFEVAGTTFACEMDIFREITPTRQVTRLPGAPNTICGLINLRGTIVTVIDGGLALGKGECMKSGGLILLVDCSGKLVGFGVDDVHDIEDVPIDRFVEPAATDLRDTQGVASVTEIDGERVLVMDVKSIARQIIGLGRDK
jgi:purine-binding chemotaxis protein CheW